MIEHDLIKNNVTTLENLRKEEKELRKKPYLNLRTVQFNEISKVYIKNS